MTKQTRVAIYELQDGSEDVFDLGTSPEAEQHERASANQEIHSRANLESRNPIVNVRFEWRDAQSVLK